MNPAEPSLKGYMRNVDKKIMVDLDCVLLDFLTPYLKWCHEYLDIDTSKFEMTAYDWPKKFVGDGCSAFWNSDLYFNQVKPFDDARRFLCELSENNVNYSICTIAEEKFYLRKKEMILNFFPLFDLEIHILPITTQKRHSLECDESYIFIDDRKSYIDPELDILFNKDNLHPWAENHSEERFRVMRTYPEVLEYILGE